MGITLGGHFAWAGGYDVTIIGDLAYVAAGAMLIVDLSTPAMPVLMDSFNTVGGSRETAILGNWAFVADSWAGMTVFDIECPFFVDGYESGDTTMWSASVGGVP